MLIEMKIPSTIIAFSLVVRFLRRFVRAIRASAGRAAVHIVRRIRPLF